MEPAVTQSSAEAGMTLIELVIVVAVMASLAVGVSLVAVRPGGGSPRDLAAFRAVYEQARNLAVHGRMRRGLVLSAQGHRSALWRDDGWQLGARQQVWRGRVSYLVEGRRAAPQDPNILFLPNGQTSAFSIQFERTRCHSDGWTGLICDAS